MELLSTSIGNYLGDVSMVGSHGSFAKGKLAISMDVKGQLQVVASLFDTLYMSSQVVLCLDLSQATIYDFVQGPSFAEFLGELSAVLAPTIFLGITTRMPYMTQLHSTVRSLQCSQYGFISSSGIWVGHPVYSNIPN